MIIKNERERERERETERQTDRQTNRQTDRHRHRQTDRQTPYSPLSRWICANEPKSSDMYEKLYSVNFANVMQYKKTNSG